MNAPEAILFEAPADTLATVLCVDDEAHILAALKRCLRRAGYGVLTASSGAQALGLLQEMPLDIVLCDMRMPGMDGAQLLEQVQQRWPQVVSILLTGQADVDSTVAAVNRGRIFKVLRKPWDEAELLAALHEGMQHLLQARETQRQLALAGSHNDTLTGRNSVLESRVQARSAELTEAQQRLQRNHLKTIKVFSNLLELRSEALAGHSRRVSETARDIARAMGLPDAEVLQVFVAGLLHDIGLIGLPDALLAKPLLRYAPEEMAQFRGHPAAAEHALAALDDMQAVLAIVRSHHERFDGDGFPDKLAGTAIRTGARIVAVADAFDDLQHGQLVPSRLTAAEARTLLRQGRGTQFCPEAMDVFLHITEPEKPKPVPAGPPALRVPASALEPDMVLATDLVSARGVLMLTAGHRFTPSLIRRVREFELREGSQLQIHIRPPGG